MFQKYKKTIEFIGSMCLSAVVFLFIYKFIPIVYSTNDDRMIAEIISGQFTGHPESYAIQMTYGFSWFLSRLYLLARGFQWYGILLILIEIVSFGAILYRLQSFTNSRKGKLGLMLTAIGIFVALWLKVYVQMTYTVTAAFVGFAAIFWYATSKSDWKNILMSGILANLAFCIRPNVFYMLVPATGLIYLWKLIGKKQLDRKTVMAPFLILAVTASLFVVDAAAYSKEGWKEFKQFFNDRTDIYDYYDLADYQENPQLYEPYGISEEEYRMIRVYNYTVMGDIPKEFFPQYIEAYKNVEKEEGITFGTKAWNAVKTFGNDVIHNAYGLENTGLFVIVVGLLGVMIWKKRYLFAAYLALQCAACGALWLYFAYWERAIERIQVSMSLIFLAVVLHAFYELYEMAQECEPLQDKAEKLQIQNVWKKAGIVLAIAIIFFFAGMNFKHYRYENIAKADRYNDVQAIKEYCAKDPERLYYMDVATMTELYGRFTIKNTEPEYINYIQLGDWSAYCPHYEKKLKNHGVENIADSVTDENTYVIMLHNYQLQCLKDYLKVEERWEESIFGANEQIYAVYQFDEAAIE